MTNNTKVVVAIFCVIRLALHLIGDSNSGFQGDELLHLETGNHLAFGYMEFPPLIGLLAFIQNLFGSTSIYVHHIFAHAATVLIFILLAKITVELGGKTKAVFLVLLCVLPIMGRAHQLFQPVIFSQLFWILSFYQLTCYVKYLNKKHLWYLTFSLILGFLTKYDIVFFIFGLVSLLLFTRTRTALIQQKFWLNILFFVLVVSPNIIWQYLNDFPALQMFTRLYETQLESLSPVEVITELILSTNPINLIIIIPGIIFLFHKKFRQIAPLSIAIALSTVLLAVTKGKSYYFYPIILSIIPFGGIYWESMILEKRKIVFYPLTIILIVSAVLYLPFSLPLTSLQSYLKHEYKYEKVDVKGGKYAVREERYSRQKWEETLNEIKKIYDSLPQNEQRGCLIWGKHYGPAGGIALFRKKYQIPPAFSYHGSFYSWAPTGEMPATIIAIRSSTAEGKDFFEPYFEEVIPVKSIYNPYSNKEEKLWQTIFICKQPKQNFYALKHAFKNRIFE